MKQTMLIAIGVIMCGSTVLADGLQTQEIPSSELIKQNRQIVTLASEEISKTLPQKVDQYTVLKKVLGKDTTLTYVFEINTGAKSDETVKSEDHSRMKKAVTKGICTSSKRFLEAEISISYLYKSAVSKAVLFQFDVSKEDCPKVSDY